MKNTTQVDRALHIIEDCITHSKYLPIETERLELKNLSGGWGDDWYKTVCAFLNTQGGIIIIGIQDKNNSKPQHYKFTGYNNSESNESHLKNILPKKFTDKDGNSIDLTSYLSRIEIRPYFDGHIAIVYVDELPDDEKYVFFNGIAYTRRITGDYELTNVDIQEYEELKEEVIKQQELEVIKDAPIDVVNIDKLNDYITRLKRGKNSGETLKPNLDAARSFLHRKSFVRDNHPTLLGMLVCGDNVEDYIQGKCEVDCYVKSPIKVANDKQVFRDNIINLIEDSFSFIYRNIQVGVGYTKGGTAEPEYPEDLVRESINNAVAHRNYKTNRFVIIEIKPNESLMIQNPGAFGRRQIIQIDTKFGKIRRIIPIQVARNPKLADLLKSFDRWEGIGKGLTSLIDACLENLIDVPYYILTEGEIKLFIPKGKVYDEEMEIWLKSFSGYIQKKYDKELTEDEKIMLSFYRKSEQLNRLENYTILLTMDNNHKEVIANLEENGLIFKDPQSPSIYPIYRVDRTLMKNDYTKELKNIYSDQYELLSVDYLDVLQTIYQFENFSEKAQISANFIANTVFIRKNSNISDVAKYEKYRARVRAVINQLERKGFIIRKDGKSKEGGGKPDFIINKNFDSVKQTTLF